MPFFAKDYAKLVEYTKVLEDYESEMVVDELIAYLKDKMYNHDALFSTLVLERFFRILSESKYLFSINADGSFVLSMIFFKMIEALKIREIDQMIESFEKDVKRPDIIVPQKEIVKEETKSSPAKIKVQETTPEMNGQVANKLATPKISETQIPKQETQIKQHLVTFNELITKIKDRNYELGECFTNNIHFIAYENNTLTWESCADEDCKKVLKHGYSVIKQLVRETFSFETKIKGIACTQEQKREPTAQIQQPEMQSGSTIGDIEAGGAASCVTNCNEASIQDETNGTDITKEPMIQKAIEMFEAKKVTVQSKI